MIVQEKKNKNLLALVFFAAGMLEPGALEERRTTMEPVRVGEGQPAKSKERQGTRGIDSYSVSLFLRMGTLVEAFEAM